MYHFGQYQEMKRDCCFCVLLLNQCLQCEVQVVSCFLIVNAMNSGWGESCTIIVKLSRPHPPPPPPISLSLSLALSLSVCLSVCLSLSLSLSLSVCCAGQCRTWFVHIPRLFIYIIYCMRESENELRTKKKVDLHHHMMIACVGVLCVRI